MHRTSKLTGFGCDRLHAWLSLAIFVAAIGCGPAVDSASDLPAHTNGPAPAGVAGGAASAPEAAAAEPAAAEAAAAEPASVPVPASSGPIEPARLDAAPDRPIYEVPVASDDLKPFASFAVGEVNWRVAADGVELEYDFPAALSGRSGQRVAFAGQLVASGQANLSGEVGTANCTFTASVVRCAEAMTGLELDPARARSMLSGRPESEQDLRGRVIESFSADPIGVLSFAPADDSGDRHRH